VSVVEVVQPSSAMWYSYILGCDRSVFSLCQLRGAVTALNLTGVCSVAVSYVGQLLLWMWWQLIFFYSNFPVTTLGNDLFWGSYINKLPFLWSTV